MSPVSASWQSTYSVGPNKILRMLERYASQPFENHPSSLLELANTLQVPFLRVKLNESSFGLGLCYDSVTIEPFDERQRHVGVNVVPILAFIQGVLRYEPLHGTRGAGYWEFTRNVPFKG